MKFRDALFTLLVFAAPGAFGQNSASLGGTIQDSTGAVVPKATVRLTSHEQGTVRSAESNQTGLYSFTFLPRGVYDVEVTGPIRLPRSALSVRRRTRRRFR